MTKDQRPSVGRLDSARLRVLAHPLRFRLLAALRVYGAANATRLAQRFDTNSGATSYHLRKLAEVGLVEEDEQQGTGRERWWRATHELTSWTETEFIDDPDDRAAADWLLGQYILAKSHRVNDWLSARYEWPREWRDAADSSDFLLRLTPQQLSALNNDLRRVIERYMEAGSEQGDAIQPVIVQLDSFPSPETWV